MAIRETEDQLPTITESIMRMRRNNRLFYLITYYQVAKQLLFSGKKYFLDIGCGDGLFLRFLHLTFRGSKKSFTYVGIDISLRKLRFAQNNHPKLDLIKTHFILADAAHLPFKGSTFEIETAIEVLEHLLDAEAFISEMCRVSRLRGKIVITTPSTCGTMGILTFLRRLNFKRSSANERQKYIIIEGKRLPHRDFTLSEIKTLFSKHFNIDNIYSFNFGMFYIIIAKFLPYKFLIWTTLYLENNALKLPKSLGNNWIVCAENKQARKLKKAKSPYLAPLTKLTLTTPDTVRQNQ
jgi:ubiquinone/menaquinone biosynthesis C-methylase UbiE